MAKKKNVTVSVSSVAPDVGDKVIVISPTILDDGGKLSDLSATGTITKLDPAPGWDYEVTFDGILSLDGRENIKTRFYNDHQIVKLYQQPQHITKIDEFGVFEMMRRVSAAINEYNHIIDNIKNIESHIPRMRKPEDLLCCYQDLDKLYSKLPRIAEQINGYKSKVASEIRSLLDEYPKK